MVSSIKKNDNSPFTTLRTSYVTYELRFGKVDVFTRDVAVHAMEVCARNTTVVTVLLNFGTRAVVIVQPDTPSKYSR